MKLNRMLRQLGVERHVRFSTLVTNWYRQVQLLERGNLEVRPLRVGAKRVVLEVGNPKYRRHFRMLYAVILLPVCLAIILLPTLNQQTKHSQRIPPLCNQLESGKKLTNLTNWKFEFKILYQLGNMSSFKTIARCRLQEWKGIMIISESPHGRVIKKLTPDN